MHDHCHSWHGPHVLSDVLQGVEDLKSNASNLFNSLRGDQDDGSAQVISIPPAGPVCAWHCHVLPWILPMNEQGLAEASEGCSEIHLPMLNVNV